jgi:hypothetical protein
VAFFDLPDSGIAGHSRCYGPSEGFNEASESMHRNIYFAAELADCV